MNETEDLRGEELLLADFLDDAYERLKCGDRPDPGSLADPALAPRGQQLLDDLLVVLDAAAALHGAGSRMLADALDNSDCEPPEAAEQLPDPFPGEFRLRALLGRGAFGKVFLADDVGLGRPVALKAILTGGKLPAADGLRLLQQEARMLASVRHPHVVQVHAWRTSADGTRYLVMDYVAGGSLAARVGREGPLPWHKAARYAAEAGEGLLEVQARGIVHRDVKPSNLLWDLAADHALLTDLGVAARMNQQGSFGGTPFYMPPEAFEGRVGPAQDVYGLAASLFWLATGQLPFPGPTRELLLVQSRRGLAVDDPRAAALPAALQSLVRAGLAADPAVRLGMREFVASLRATLNRLLADRVVALAGNDHGPVRLLISKRTAPHTFVPLATARPRSKAVRDVVLVPEEPERAEARTGDRLRIEVEVDLPGYLTVFNVGPTGNFNALYPPARAVPLPVEPGRPLRVGETVLTPPCGSERLVAVWSREPLAVPLERVLDRDTPGPSRATRDVMLLEESVSELSHGDWHAAVVELEHLPGEAPPRI
jgi:hypothetical protein